MKRNYHQLLPYCFKRFSIFSAVRTALPSIGYHLRKHPLPRSDKPALFTMNILPPMGVVWYHFTKKYLGDRVDTVIFDCSGRLDPDDFGDARIQKYVNRYAATKTDEFLYSLAKNRKIGWMCDDDIFLINAEAVDRVEEELHQPRTASLSFRPRDWWHFAIDGKEHPVSSSYCTAINREIYCDKEKLSLAPCDGNTHPSHIGKPTTRYDTFDKANEILLTKGYRCAVIPEEEQDRYITGYSGMSGAVMLLYHFRTPEQTLQYFRGPPNERWSGNVLFGVLSAMLAICDIQDLYRQLKGERYPLPSLPSRSDLEAIATEKTPHLREGKSFDWIEEASAILRKKF